MKKTLMISTQEKIQLVKDERVLEVTPARKKIHWKIKRHMNMCINVPC